MKLLTKAIEKKLPAFYSTDGRGDSAVAVVKFFNPTGSWTWYATEYNPEERMFYGIVDGHELESGYFSLDELESFRGRFGLGIERDMYWTPLTIGEIKGGKR